jgi:hypothetical protein
VILARNLDEIETGNAQGAKRSPPDRVGLLDAQTQELSDQRALRVKGWPSLIRVSPGDSGGFLGELLRCMSPKPEVARSPSQKRLRVDGVLFIREMGAPFGWCREAIVIPDLKPVGPVVRFPLVLPENGD